MASNKALTLFARTIALIGPEAFERLQAARVAVFGLGGVGAACAEALARSGVGTLALVDHDVISPGNINRQLIALNSTLGQQKTSACAIRLRDINPEINVIEHPVFYTQDTAGAIHLEDFDAVADCVDTLAAKVLLAQLAPQAGAYLVSCMGTGNRLDPGKLIFDDIYRTDTCPLARRMRKACRVSGIKSLRVLFSREEPLRVITQAEQGRHAPGAMAFVPPVAGMMMAGDIVTHLTGMRPERM